MLSIYPDITRKTELLLRSALHHSPEIGDVIPLQQHFCLQPLPFFLFVLLLAHRLPGLSELLCFIGPISVYCTKVLQALTWVESRQMEAGMRIQNGSENCENLSGRRGEIRTKEYKEQNRLQRLSPLRYHCSCHHKKSYFYCVIFVRHQQMDCFLVVLF